MIRNLYTSALGMTTQMNKMDITTNNIANASTTAFKKDFAITQSFSKEMVLRIHNRDKGGVNSPTNQIGKFSQGVFVQNVKTDFSSANLTQTNSELDLAIDGEGFFAVSFVDKNGVVSERYTRDGSFTISKDGKLQTKDGHDLVIDGLTSALPKGEIIVGENGDVKVNSELIGKIKIVAFADNSYLKKSGNNLFENTQNLELIESRAKVSQGFLENSNINVVQEMVDLITISRAFEANQKIVSMMDTTFGQAVADIGKKI